MEETELYRYFAWSAVLLWFVLIFTLSEQPAAVSNELSKGMTGVMIEHAEKVVPDGEFNIGKLNHIVRKYAHFFYYLILVALVINALRQSGRGREPMHWLCCLVCSMH